MERKTIAFDTNMLLAIAQFKADVFSQAREIFGKNVSFAVPEQVFEELAKLSKSKKMRKKILLVKKIMKQNNVKKIIVEAQNADSGLEKLASQGMVVATNDKALRKKIKVFGNHIYLKKKRFIATD